MPATHALIVNYGSMNTCPYTIDVMLNSVATYTVGSMCQSHGSRTLDATRTIHFFDDVLKAMPLDQLPFVPCSKPSSFGTVTVISYGQQKTPDISCPSRDSRVTHLFDDFTSIIKALGFSIYKRPQIRAVMAVRAPFSLSTVARVVARRHEGQRSYRWSSSSSLWRQL
ncbi:hypothetical protein KDAU_42950 [Dictyobacter aurantiacus]|uniref:Uncharacterized protein n=1 Tax=Dictyobacter aurantiacus TaxID=1936993 RepID=A0A401ZJD4_9CHLR|nr:hypothetical protein KDAU_42950 [Dictyobacter aurantiacus]